MGFDEHLVLALEAESAGLDFVGIMDHPYQPRYVDTMSLIALLIARTERLRFFPDVANLPLRPAAILAKAAATLDLMSGGRFELGIGAGGYWKAITTLGIPQRTPREAVDALEEAIHVIRAMWSGERDVHLGSAQHYALHGANTGPVPSHTIGIWVGAQSPRTLALTGRLADGWAAPIPSYLPYERWGNAQDAIDSAASAAGRDARSITRLAQVVGTITDRDDGRGEPGGSAPIRASTKQWATVVARLVCELRFDTVIFWPEQATLEQVRLFGRDVAPRARELAAETPQRFAEGGQPRRARLAVPEPLGRRRFTAALARAVRVGAPSTTNRPRLERASREQHGGWTSNHACPQFLAREWLLPKMPSPTRPAQMRKGAHQRFSWS